MPGGMMADEGTTDPIVLKNIVDSLDDIDEPYRAAYTEGKDGEGNPVYQLQTEDNIGLKTALERERGNVQNLEKELKPIKDAKITVSRYKEMQSELKALREKSDKGETDLEKLKAEMSERYDSEMVAKDERINELTGVIRKLVVEDAAMKAIVEAKGNPKLLTPHVMNHLDMEERNGTFKAVVVDEANKPRIGDMHGNPMTVKQLVEELRDDDSYAAAFDGRQKSGAGVQTRTTSGTLPKNLPEDPMARIMAYRKHKGGAA
jgi:hypothetical protein